MKKGIVMSIDDEFCTVLTPDGEFLKARKQSNITLGEEFYFYPIEEIETAKPSLWSRFKTKNMIITTTSLIAAILLFLSFLPMMLTSNQVYAYVSIDINPSIEIGINDQLDVISIEAMNDDGTKLLNNLPDWKNEHIDTVTKAIIEKSMQEGFLNDDTKEVLITTIVNGNETNASNEIDQELEELSEQYEKDKQIIVTTETSNLEIREKAKSQGLSTGKLIQLEKQKQKELNNTEDTLKETTGNSSAEKTTEPAENKTTKTLDVEKDKNNNGNRNKDEEKNSNGNNGLENENHNNGNSNKENKNNSNKSNAKNKVDQLEKKENNASNRNNVKKKEQVKKNPSQLDYLKSPRERLEKRLKELPGNGRGNSNGNGRNKNN